MGLNEQVMADIAQITGNLDEWGCELTFETPGPSGVAYPPVVGLHSKHHTTFNTDGVAVNGRKAHVSVSESFLIAIDYPLRNTDGDVSLADHKVTVKDSTGIAKKYVISEWFPDERVGLIVCILGGFSS